MLVGCGPSVDIWTAAKEGNIEAVKQHLDAGTDVNAKNEFGLTPLHRAASRGHKEIAELLIAKGADVNAKDKRGTTPLHEAAGRGHNKDVAELLIAKGADVNAKDDNGWTPLHHAVPDGHKEIAELLIAKGGNVNAKGIYGTPLDHAEAEWEGDVDEVNAARNEVADLLRKHGGKRSTINLAAGAGDTEGVKEFLAAGTDVNIKDKYGKTPLDWAVEHDKPETSDLLRKHGGKTSEELKAEESIHDAARFGITEAIKQHLAAGTDVNAKDKDGFTPLIQAVQRGQKEVAKLLIEKGADVNAKTAKGGTPLDWANAGNHSETADLLRKHGGKTGEELKAEGK